MSIKQKKYLFIVLISVAIYLICFAMYTRVTSANASLRFIQESMGMIDGESAASTTAASETHHKDVTTPHENVTAPGKHVTAPDEHVKAPDGHANAPDERVSVLLQEDPPFQPKGAPVDLKYSCIDRLGSHFGRVEDVFCTALGKLEPQFKNPCFYDYRENGVKRLRCLPYFYMIGPDKCGTTDLHSRMVTHPQLMDNNGVIKKETSYWGWRHFGNMNWRRWYRNETSDFYMDMFGRTAQLLQTGGPAVANVVTGDASPMDFYDFHFWHYTPQNWGKEEPEVLTPMLIRGLHAQASHIPKMMTQLRDPIERVFSLYVFLGGGNDPDKFHRDVVDSLEKLKQCTVERGRRVCFFDGPLFHSMPVKIQTSCYSVFLKEWFAAFPRKNFYIVRMEDTSANMKQALIDIYSFLELEPLEERKLLNISGKAKKHVTRAKVGVTMLPKTAELLKEFYQPCNEELAHMLQDKRFLWEDNPHD